MGEIFYGTKVLLLFGAIACVLVVVAMMADLIAGVYKSKLRGEFAQSELLKRTGYKFCLYEGSLLVGQVQSGNLSLRLSFLDDTEDSDQIAYDTSAGTLTFKSPVVKQG